jgi:chromosome segregation ATPase
MHASRKILEDHLQRYEMQLRSLNSYIKELSDRTAELGTDRAQFEDDLFEAENNVKYYEAEIARIKTEIGEPAKAGRTQTGAEGTILPQTVKQGIGSFIFSAIGFVAGALLGSRLKSRRGSTGGPEDNGER